MTITRRFKESYYCRIDMSAFAAVMLVLVAFSTITCATHPHGGGMELVRANNPVSEAGANRENAMLLAVLKDGTMFFGTNRIIDRQHLVAAIRVTLEDKTVERKIYIKVDPRAKYGYVAEALDGVSGSGIEKIAFLVEKRKLESF